jgi:glycosyltransferase involved in cell wall biosynthesis
MPSLWYENQPMVILEAFAAGVPVIGSCIGGIPELVVNRQRGLLVEAGSAHELAQAMTQLHREPAKARTFGQNAREYVMRHHSVDGHIATVTDIYRQAIKSVERPHIAVAERQTSWT